MKNCEGTVKELKMLITFPKLNLECIITGNVCKKVFDISEQTSMMQGFCSSDNEVWRNSRSPAACVE